MDVPSESQTREKAGWPMTRRIYLICKLPPETVAVTFAKTSRSPEPFDIIAEGLTDKKSAEFHERWVVGYGHSSVAEHAVLHIALEDISIAAAKAIEENRLSSFTEKSTRYQVYDPERFFRPPAVIESGLGEKYVRSMQQLMRLYIEGIEQTVAWHQQYLTREKDETDRAFAGRCRAKSCDLMRYFLPAGTLTNLGWTVNARVLEYAISKLLISPLNELRDIGNEIKEVACDHVPTLVKYAQPNEYLAHCGIPSQQLPPELPEEQIVAHNALGENEVRLVKYDPAAEDKVIAALAYPRARGDYEHLLAWVRSLSVNEKDSLLQAAIGSPRSFDAGPRALEAISYTFEITIDYGAWRDIQRHRMCTQLLQEFSPDLGYAEPKEFGRIGLSKTYRQAREVAMETYRQMTMQFPADAKYVLPLGYRVRTIFIMNLREAFHFVRLRSSPHGHQSYRRVAVKLWDQIAKVHPLLARHLRAC